MSEVVVVGGGLAGAKAVEGLRAGGFDGAIRLVCDEAVPPYERPPLSKDYLAGSSTLEDAQVLDPGLDVEVILNTRATGLDVAARSVALPGRTLRYDRLLIATGAVARRPPVPGIEGGEVHVLRTAADADRLRAVLAPGARIVVVGGGWIGCEVAATARGAGAAVTLVEMAGAPLERVLGTRLGGFFADVHRGHGVELILGAGVRAFGAEGRRVKLTDGRVLDCDAVVLGVGVAPATGLAEAGGLAVDDGIVCDDRFRTSAPGVFAAGDVASVMHPRYGRRIRVEHWDTARAHGAAAARSMLGEGEPYDRLPYFFSDQYDLGLEYVGRHDPADELVVHGSFEDARFQAFWIAADGRVSAGMHVNDWDAIGPIRALVEQRAVLA